MDKIRTLDDVVKNFEDELKKNPIDIETFRDWQASPVTQKLYLDTTRAILESMMDNTITFTGIEEVALRQAFSRGMQEAFQLVVEWEPENYI